MNVFDADNLVDTTAKDTGVNKTILLALAREIQVRVLHTILDRYY